MQTAASSEFIYERIARRLSTQIEEGVYRAGDRLPSVRRLCVSEQVSPASVMQALAMLEARGFAEARPKSGFYVQARPKVPPPPPPRTNGEMKPQFVGIAEVVTRVLQQAGNPKMVPLGAALPAPHLLPTERLSRCLASAARRRPARLGLYEISAGEPQLLRQLARRFSAIGCPISQEEIIVTMGAMEALNLAIRAVTQPGDIVAVESPCYFGILQILESLRLKALPIPGTCDHGIDLDLLAASIERHPVKAVVLVPSFNNPNGSCLDDERRRALIRLLADHEVPLIEDDNYGDLYFGKMRPRPIKALDEKGLVLYCGSFSKCLAPGLRVGWLASGRFVEEVRRLKFVTTLTTPAINQAAIAAFLEHGSMERHLRKLRSAFQSHVAQIGEAVLKAFPDGTALSSPRGGFFLWVQLPEGCDALDLHRAADAKGIMIIPGQAFFPNAKRSNCIRLSCGYPLDAAMEQGIKTLGRLVRDLQKDALRGSKQARRIEK